MEFIDLKRQYQKLKKEIDESVASNMKNAAFIMGKDVDLFEQELALYLGIKHVITCGSGTDALQLLYMAYGIKPKDVIFCPDVTFISSVEPAVLLGGIPVFCDINKDTYNLSPDSLERQICRVRKEGIYRPRFVVAVDFLGNPGYIDEIYEICKKYDLIMIEDGAQSFGASYKKKPCCSMGNSAVTSFFPAKPLGAYGDGGAIFTNDDSIAGLCRSMRVHGKGKSKYDNIRIGLNSRLDSIQAGILRIKLKALKDYEISARDMIAQNYNKKFQNYFKIPYTLPGCKSIYAQYALLAKDENTRDNMIDRLKKNEVPSMIYYPKPLHSLEVFKNAPTYGEKFQNAVEYCKRTFSIPMHPYLTEEEQEYVIKTLIE